MEEFIPAQGFLRHLEALPQRQPSAPFRTARDKAIYYVDEGGKSLGGSKEVLDQPFWSW